MSAVIKVNVGLLALVWLVRASSIVNTNFTATGRIVQFLVATGVFLRSYNFRCIFSIIISFSSFFVACFAYVFTVG